MLRPTLPSLRVAEKYLAASREGFQFANFGPAVLAAERRLEELMGKKARLTHTGTDALHVALSVKRRIYGRAKSLLMPEFTHLGTYAAVETSRCTDEVVFLRPWGNSWCVTPKQFRARLKANPDAKLAIVVAPFGVIPNVPVLDRIAAEYGCEMVYDFAGAWPRVPETRHPVCYSLHATKSLPIGEGGFILFGSETEHELARRIMNFDLHPDRRARHTDGGNHKMDDVRAALLLAALEHPQRYRNRVARRRSFLSRIRMYKGYRVPRNFAAPSLVVVECETALIRDRLRILAEQRGIEVRQNYIRLSQMPAFPLEGRAVPSQLDNCVALPSDATPDEQEEILALLADAVPSS